ncbi:hypothetical protein ACFVUS_09760 [Nocardia sp. NPDC058058]|uniref:hypothetical protein n=1 Tax=Nocardia sp. NPDC058058 TaxID=3346317 RepID=UPI0036D8491D
MINDRPTTTSAGARDGNAPSVTPAPAPRRPKTMWLVGGGIAAVLLIGGGIAVVVGNSDSSSGAGAAGKKITELPDQCSLITPQTLAVIAPGAGCRTQAFAGQSISVSPTWTVESNRNDPTSINVTLTRTTDPRRMYDDAKGAVGLFNSAHDIQISNPLQIGDEAQVAGGRSHINPALFEARAIGCLDNGAVATVTFTSGTDTATAVEGATKSLADTLGKLR